jgi:hypothetical protein
MIFPLGLYVLIAAGAAGGVTEFVAWLLVYRTDQYKRLKSGLMEAERKLEVCCRLRGSLGNCGQQLVPMGMPLCCSAPKRWVAFNTTMLDAEHKIGSQPE